jgi:hypothetical protein
VTIAMLKARFAAMPKLFPDKNGMLTIEDNSAEPPYGFRGVVIVCAESMDDALNKSWALKLNPGGEVLAGLMDHTPEEKWVNHRSSVTNRRIAHC